MRWGRSEKTRKRPRRTDPMLNSSSLARRMNGQRSPGTTSISTTNVNKNARRTSRTNRNSLNMNLMTRSRSSRSSRTARPMNTLSITNKFCSNLIRTSRESSTKRSYSPRKIWTRSSWGIYNSGILSREESSRTGKNGPLIDSLLNRSKSKRSRKRNSRSTARRRRNRSGRRSFTRTSWKGFMRQRRPRRRGLRTLRCKRRMPSWSPSRSRRGKRASRIGRGGYRSFRIWTASCSARSRRHRINALRRRCFVIKKDVNASLRNAKRSKSVKRLTKRSHAWFPHEVNGWEISSWTWREGR